MVSQNSCRQFAVSKSWDIRFVVSWATLLIAKCLGSYLHEPINGNYTIMSQQINGYDLIAIGYPQNELLGIALKVNKKRNRPCKS